VCHEVHVADQIGSTYPNARWKWNRETLTLSPSYECGEFIVHGDSTAKPPRGRDE
jgi:hypothetical protein